jgi:hypothetical protein
MKILKCFKACYEHENFKYLVNQIEGWTNSLYWDLVADVIYGDYTYIVLDNKAPIAFMTVINNKVFAIEVKSEYRGRGISLYLLSRGRVYEPIDNLNIAFWDHIDNVLTNKSLHESESNPNDKYWKPLINIKRHNLSLIELDKVAIK